MGSLSIRHRHARDLARRTGRNVMVEINRDGTQCDKRDEPLWVAHKRRCRQ
jgi:hypothetical protein